MMSGSVLEHPLVRDYLRRLDAACAALPAADARELHDQIIAHLDEAVPPGAADDEILAGLARLGTPAELAAEAAGPVPRSAGARLLSRLGRLRLRAWASIAAALAVLAAAGTYTILVTTAPPLVQAGLQGWWYQQDAAHAVSVTADGVNQTTVPERFGQQQGFVIGMMNNSDWTQTIVGVAPGSEAGSMIETVTVGPSVAADGQGIFPNDKTRWTLDGSIAPHSYRVIRVIWTSYTCDTPGASTVFMQLGLRVRVGIITRIEKIPLDTAWGITGTKASDSVKACR